MMRNDPYCQRTSDEISIAVMLGWLWQDIAGFESNKCDIESWVRHSRRGPFAEKITMRTEAPNISGNSTASRFKRAGRQMTKTTAFLKGLTLVAEVLSVRLCFISHDSHSVADVGFRRVLV